jgi:hypothetical protein
MISFTLAIAGPVKLRGFTSVVGVTVVVVGAVVVVAMLLSSKMLAGL